MALDNLHCPQFVDFTNPDTFNTFDGADIYFESGIVGELELGFKCSDPAKDGIDELIAALNDNASITTTPAPVSTTFTSEPSKKDSGISVSPANQSEAPAAKKPLACATNRKRTTSTTSQHQIKTAPPPPPKSDNKGIFKKTIGKVTAAFKGTTASKASAESSSGSGVSSSLFKLKSKSKGSAPQPEKKPLKVEHAPPAVKTNEPIDALEINNNTSESNRRCSSVPRTLKERQAVARQATIGEKIQSFFSSSGSSSGSSSAKPKSGDNVFAERKSRVDGEKKMVVPAVKPVVCKLTEPRSPKFLSKPRQRSVDRKDAVAALPYQGVKFIPKLAHKYTPAEPFSANQMKSMAKKLTDVEMSKTSERVNSSLVGRLNSSLNSSGMKNGVVNKENNASVCVMNTSNGCGGDNGAHNTSTCSQKSVIVPKKPGAPLHSETRAAKRHQYDQYLKDKEKMQELIKKNLDMQKAIENKNDIQKLRSQMTFKSRPFKQCKPMEIRPSEKPLTDPRSPSRCAKIEMIGDQSQDADNLE